ncbi:aminoglycoside N(3)-acetyltransferase [Marinicrinis lubricantis]|uniref:Aminoglycoside N(3)-acetyltransferase n=1 Tax=Marinicrinis lubricantis TaxID=2086470 RepID=A0ABW1IPQ8_9BACL
MTIIDIIQRTKQPMTKDRLYEIWRRLGIERGDKLMVHSSLSSLGYVIGGASAVIESLIAAVGESGTLIMPSQSTDLSNPSGWGNPPVPEDWWPLIYKHMPPYDVDRTPTCGMGAIAELFRTYPNVCRSKHPQTSFCALGKDAQRIMEMHELDYGLGPTSPLGICYEHDAKVLLIGVDYDRCTALHLAEYMASYPGKSEERNSAPLHSEEGVSLWTEWTDISLDTDDFIEIGQSYEAEGNEVAKAQVNGGQMRAMSMRPLVDYAAHWMEQHRGT